MHLFWRAHRMLYEYLKINTSFMFLLVKITPTLSLNKNNEVFATSMRQYLLQLALKLLKQINEPQRGVRRQELCENLTRT